MTQRYYIQHGERACGNDVLWWQKGGGYTTDLDKAEQFTIDQLADRQARGTDRPFLVEVVDQLAYRAVDTGKLYQSLHPL